MSAAATPPADRRANALSDLEPQIYELAHMAELARFYISEFAVSPNRTEKQRLDGDRVCDLAYSEYGRRFAESFR